MKITFQRKYIGWGTAPDEPLETVVRIYVPTDYQQCHYINKLHSVVSKFHKAGYDTEIGYSDRVVCISK